MKFFLIFLIFTLAIWPTVQSQEYDLTGEIRHTNEDPLAFANILLLRLLTLPLLRAVLQMKTGFSKLPTLRKAIMYYPLAIWAINLRLKQLTVVQLKFGYAIF